MKRILEKVLVQIVPSAQESQQEKKIAQELEQKIKKIEGKHVDVRLLGSLARNTHLRGDRDLDLFVFFPKKLSRTEFEKEGLRIGKKVLKGNFWEEAYSEHPYIRGTYKGHDVEIVPTYKIKGIHEKKSSVDRTPFHHQYLGKKMMGKQKNEVRLLKRFLKGIQAYGADTHYNSFSGYAAELLIINYKSFAQTIRAISKWKTPLVIDLEKYWKPKTCQKQFPHFPLILIDPTDPNRNVAAALSAEQLERIIRASKSFLKKPSLSFFFPAPTKPWNPTKIRQKGKQQKIIGIALGYPAKTISDIVWAQLNRLTKKMKIFFDQFDFEIKRIQAFTNEKNSIVVLATLKENRLPSIQKRIGPFAGDTENVKRFLKKHRITHYKTQKGHVMLETKRKIRSAKDCLKLFLKESAITTRPPLQKAFQKKKLLTSENLGKETKKNKGLRIFATEFLKKETRF